MIQAASSAGVTWSSWRSTLVRSSLALRVTVWPGATFAKTERAPSARATTPSFWLRDSPEIQRMSGSYSVAGAVLAAIFFSTQVAPMKPKTAMSTTPKTRMPYGMPRTWGRVFVPRSPAV